VTNRFCLLQSNIVTLVDLVSVSATGYCWTATKGERLLVFEVDESNTVHHMLFPFTKPIRCDNFELLRLKHKDRRQRTNTRVLFRITHVSTPFRKQKCFNVSELIAVIGKISGLRRLPATPRQTTSTCSL